MCIRDSCIQVVDGNNKSNLWVISNDDLPVTCNSTVWNAILLTVSPLRWQTPARGVEILRSGGVHRATGALNPAHLRFLGNYVDFFTIFGFFWFYSPFAVLHDRANPPFPLYHLGGSNTPWEQGPARYKDLTHPGTKTRRIHPCFVIPNARSN